MKRSCPGNNRKGNGNKGPHTLLFCFSWRWTGVECFCFCFYLIFPAVSKLFLCLPSYGIALSVTDLIGGMRSITLLSMHLVHSLPDKTSTQASSSWPWLPLDGDGGTMTLGLHGQQLNAVFQLRFNSGDAMQTRMVDMQCEHLRGNSMNCTVGQPWLNLKDTLTTRPVDNAWSVLAWTQL